MLEAKRRSWPLRPTRVIAPLVILAVTLAGGSLLAGSSLASVKGKMTGWEKLLPQVYVEAAKSDSHRYTWREPSPTVKQDYRKLSANVSRDVCIVALGSGTAQAHEPLLVKLTGGRTTPATVVLSPGSRLSFKNADPFAHVLYEAGNDKWAPNALAPGSSREWAATAPGLHEIRDQVFPSVVMYVVVDAAAVEFAFPDREGSFTMSMPPGDYTFRAFFDGKQVSKDGTTVHVSERGLEMKEPISVGGDSK
jgi:hypothetical protein